MGSSHKMHDTLAKIAAMDPESCGLIDAIHLAREALAPSSTTAGDAVNADGRHSINQADCVGVVTTGFVSAHGHWRQELVLSKKEFLPSGTHVFVHSAATVSKGTPVAFDVMCESCGGSGLNRDDSNYGCGSCNSTGFIEKMLYPEVSPVAINDAEFKNFHRLLCERFEYAHDPVHWKRDQVSLIEWIAKQVKPEAAVNEQLLDSVKLLQGIASQFARHNEKVCRAIAQAEYQLEQAQDSAVVSDE